MSEQNQRIVFRRVRGRIVPIKVDEKSARKKEGGNAVYGTAATGTGAYAVSKSKPLVTGRTTLYHGTTKKNAEHILKKGLVPGKSVGISDTLDGSVGASNFTYMTRSRKQARQYAGQAVSIEKISRGKTREAAADAISRYARSIDRIRDLVKAGYGFHDGEVLKAEIPYWSDEYKKMSVKNPELLGAKNGDEWLMKKLSQSGNRAKPNRIVRMQANALYRALDTPTFAGKIPAHAFKKSKAFKRLGLSELRHYAKLHKGRFGAGLALGAAGLAGIGWGLNQIYNSKFQ